MYNFSRRGVHVNATETSKCNALTFSARKKNFLLTMRTFSRPILILITFIYIYLSTISNGENDYCWKQSERSTLKFTNNDSKNMTHLPTIRLYQGYYPSQFAMQYAAYVYIREKMGVDVCNNTKFCVSMLTKHSKKQNKYNKHNLPGYILSIKRSQHSFRKICKLLWLVSDIK